MAKKENASQAPAKKKKANKAEAKAFTEAPRLKVKYDTEVIPALNEKFGYKNVNEVLIAGQHPVVTKAKKSVANFKVREGMNVGA